jgi:hypothetical protein
MVLDAHGGLVPDPQAWIYRSLSVTSSNSWRGSAYLALAAQEGRARYLQGGGVWCGHFFG